MGGGNVAALVSTKMTFEEENPRFRSNLSFGVGDNPEIVRKRRELFFREFGKSGGVEVASGNQIHSANIRVIHSGGEYPETDALITDVAGLVLSVSVADCYPVLMHSPGKCIAAVHSGWRGTFENITGKTLETMRETFDSDSGEVEVFIGAGAEACCYEVKNDVASLFAEEYIRRRDGLMFLDIRANIISQLKQAGIRANRIETVGTCTVCSPGRYHSFRREGTLSGRMVAAIVLANREGN